MGTGTPGEGGGGGGGGGTCVRDGGEEGVEIAEERESK